MCFVLRRGCPHAPGYTCRQFGTVELQKELAKDIPKVKVKVTAFARITKDMQRGAISQEDARKAKDYVRDLLYDALRDANISVEAFEQSISSSAFTSAAGSPERPIRGAVRRRKRRVSKYDQRATNSPIL